MKSHQLTLDEVRAYYGRVLQTSSDLQTNACCTDEQVPAQHKPLLAKIHDEVMSRFYGCGSPIPAALEGRTVLDLGAGSGRDSYLCSALVGPTGRVIGVDMTDEQLAVARRHQDYHAQAFGHPRPNTSFRKGYIEDLAGVDVADASVDVVISNCVVNLSPDKGRVLSEVFRVLKPGGELYFSDVFADRRVPSALREDPTLYGECLSGALYIEDFRRMLRERGVLDYRVVNKRRITVNNPQLEAKLGPVNFFSVTVRAFKLDLEDLCEDYGQVAVYKGGAQGAPVRFVLDDHHTFEAGRPALVCGNTADMLQKTRFGAHFDIRGGKDVHFGAFPCGPAPASAAAPADPALGACC
jgi:SAM-dependent methyltransferase